MKHSKTKKLHEQHTQSFSFKALLLISWYFVLRVLQFHNMSNKYDTSLCDATRN